jgi:c-di-GMP-binding flagellar brake protein YcgR
MRVDKRVDPRVKLIKWPGKILAEEKSIDGIIRNISVSGAFIYYDKPHGEDLPLSPKERVGLILEAPDQPSLYIFAEVVWSDILSSDERNTLLGAGFRFINISSKDRQFLSNFVAKSSVSKAIRME